ncbi:hypothetical protein ACP4OV_015980 [Aristida adscensionis]
MALAGQKRPALLALSLPATAAGKKQPALAGLSVPARAAAAAIDAEPPSAAFLHLRTASASGEFRVADFERVAVLGRGNGGTVYKVLHRATCASYALKIVHRGDAAAEAEALGRAASPFVAWCHTVMPAASGDVALLLELAGGGSLDSVKARCGAFPEAALAEVAAQALSGLVHIHARRVVHLDIKPAKPRGGRMEANVDPLLNLFNTYYS